MTYYLHVDIWNESEKKNVIKCFCIRNVENEQKCDNTFRV